ncbi:hypothetical protein JQX13_10595 [Archangium violaceum]|uniref:hypothetical protein n=1 Tax=Archangium violaceum TaxID=83451 RepID=UPI00193B86EA|nr:hypothetical protein [Archangium violaceum]QRK10494.1 hypothetical protein JQX13_10595 [Archangium violaceum]
MSGTLVGLIQRVIVCVLVSGSASSAAHAEPWSAVLRTSSPEDEALEGRIRGQISDLPLVLKVDPGPEPGPDAAEQWRAVVALAEHHQARAVIWFSHTPRALVIHIAEPATRRMLVRRLQHQEPPTTLSRSATAETAALVVRSALKALDARLPVGEPVEVALEPEVPPPPTPLPPPAPLPPQNREASPWTLAVGWQASLDGNSPRGQQGLQLGLGWERGWLRARVLLLASLPAHLTDEYTRVSLSRHAASVVVDASPLSTERFRLGAGLGVGVAGFLRSTESLAPAAEASPPRLTPTPYASPELSARWRTGPVALETSVAVDVLAGVPTLTYQRAQSVVVRNRLWGVQPRLGLALVLGSP